jgi:hypothetical protein
MVGDAQGKVASACLADGSIGLRYGVCTRARAALQHRVLSQSILRSSKLLGTHRV